MPRDRVTIRKTREILRLFWAPFPIALLPIFPLRAQSELIRDRRIPEGLKVTTRLASRISSPPDCGFRPRLGALSLMLNLPNPLSSKSLPVINEDLDSDRKVSTESVACDFVKFG